MASCEHFIINFTGRKAGKGCFLYTPGSKERPENDEALKIIENYKIAPKLE